MQTAVIAFPLAGAGGSRDAGRLLLRAGGKDALEVLLPFVARVLPDLAVLVPVAVDGEPQGSDSCLQGSDNILPHRRIRAALKETTRFWPYFTTVPGIALALPLSSVVVVR